MKTFNDFLKAANKEEFIIQAIKEHKNSDTYRNAVTAGAYFSTDNEAIAKRLSYLERQMKSKINIKFHRLRSGFFQKAVKRLVFYLMGNGVSLPEAEKKAIDRRFDNTMIMAAVNACIDGVVWGFADVDRLTFFRATEFVPLLDERTGKAMAGIRFWQIDMDKSLYVEFYEVDGVTEYEVDKNGANIRQIQPKRAYIEAVRKDELCKIVERSENYGVLPIFPLYANELHQSELTQGLQALIDAYDFVSSDWVDNITLVEGLYGIIKNYGGEDAANLLAEIQQLKVIVQDDDSGAELKAIEMPYESRKNLLEFLERRMYSDFLLPNIQNTTNGATATEIKMLREDMDIKADLLEWQVAEFVENVLKIKEFEGFLPNFKRRSTTNDSDAIGNIATQLAGGWIDVEEAIRLDLTIPEEDKAELLDRIRNGWVSLEPFYRERQ